MAAAVTMKRVDLFITDFYWWFSECPPWVGDMPVRAVWVLECLTGSIIPLNGADFNRYRNGEARATRSSQDSVGHFAALFKGG
jgi:hypothetical protein